MAASIEERIAAAFKAALTTPALTGLTARADAVSRGREDARSLEEAPAINIRTQRIMTKPISDQVDDNELLLDVEIFVRPGQGAVWETAADAIAVQAHPRIVARDYKTLDGLKVRYPRRVEGEWLSEEGEHQPGKRTVRYAVRFLTLVNDITAQP